MMKRRLWLTFAALCCTLCLEAAEATSGSLEDLRGLVLQNVKLPVYNNDTLQMMIFCNRSERQGKFIVSRDAVMDLIQIGADADEIHDGWNLKMYPLQSPFAEIFNFWKKRLYSDGVLSSTQVSIDQKSRMAAGHDPVFFRNPIIDLNGVGFEADFTRRQIMVKSDVSVILRLNEYDPRRYFDGSAMPKDYKYITATSDALLIDMEKNVITLIDNVVVTEEKTLLNCDKMTIVLGHGADNAAKAGNAALKGVDCIYCDGNVVVRRKLPKAVEVLEGRQLALAEHLIYQVKTGVMTLSGEHSLPRVLRGKELLSGKKIVFHRETERVDVEGNSTLLMNRKSEGAASMMRIDSDRIWFESGKNLARFSGNVHVDDVQMLLDCQKMDVLLLPKAKKAVPKTNVSGGMGDVTDIAFASGGARELDKIKCFEKVYIRRKSGRGFVLTGGKAVSAAVRQEKSGPGTGVFSDESDLDYRKNLLTFTGKVRVNDPKMDLVCDKMLVHLRDQAGQAKNAASGASGKTLRQIVCIGKVDVKQKGAELKTDHLTLDFVERTKAMKNVAEIFQNDDIALSQMTANGHLVMVSKKDKNAAAAEKPETGGMKGLFRKGDRVLTADRGIFETLKNKSSFYDRVHVHDEANDLRCEEMYVFSQETGKKGTAAAPADSRKKTVADDVDDDPYAVDAAAETVPEEIELAPGLNLSRVLCIRDVAVSRKTAAGELQQAFGTQADYVVSTKQIDLTGTPEKPPYMQSKDGRMTGDKIVVYLESERMEVLGKTQLVLK